MADQDPKKLPTDWAERRETIFQPLLARWEDIWETEGREITPEELCPEWPELWEALAEDINLLKTFPTVPEVKSQTDEAAEASKFATESYEGIQPINEGGQGKVILAKDLQLDREVAVKHLKRHWFWQQSARERLEQEARITGNLEHPGVIPVYGFGHDASGNPYYAMRYMRDERTYDDVIRRMHENTDRLTYIAELKLALQSFLVICNTIDYAHDKDVIHRDIKPSNVMIGDYGEVFVADWGLAKSLHDKDSTAQLKSPEAANTAKAQSLGAGTLGYMSPEQADEKKSVGKASDIYSLGATLYHLLVGQPAFDGESISEILGKVRAGKFPHPRSANAQIPKPLEAICLKAMSPEDSNRYESAGALAADIENWLVDKPVAAWPAPWHDKVRRWMKRHRTITASAAAGVLIAMITLSITAAMLARQQAILEQSNAELRRSSYRNQFLVAASTLRDKNPSLALDILDQCDPKQRSIEWNYLARLIGRPLEPLEHALRSVYRLSMSQDASRVAVPAKLFSNMIDIYDTSTGKRIRQLDAGGKVQSMWLSSDGQLITTEINLKYEHDELRVWNVDTGEHRWSKRRTNASAGDAANYLRFVAFGDNDDFFVSTGKVGSLKVERRSCKTGGLMVTNDKPPEIIEMWTDEEPHVIQVKQLSDRTVVRTLKGFGGAGIARSACPGYDGQDLTLRPSPESTSDSVIAVADEEHHVYVWGDKKDDDPWTYQHADKIRAIALDREGSRVASASDDGNILVWDVQAQRLISRLPMHAEHVFYLRFLPDGQRLASVGMDGVLRIWDLTRSPIKHLASDFQYAIMGIHLSADHKQLVVVHHPSRVSALELPSGESIASVTLDALDLFVPKQSAINATGTLAAISTFNGPVILVDPSTGNTLKKFDNMQGPLEFILGDRVLLAVTRQRKVSEVFEPLEIATIDPKIIRIIRAMDENGVYDTKPNDRNAHDLIRYRNKNANERLAADLGPENERLVEELRDRAVAKIVSIDVGDTTSKSFGLVRREIAVFTGRASAPLAQNATGTLFAVETKNGIDVFAPLTLLHKDDIKEITRHMTEHEQKLADRRDKTPPFEWRDISFKSLADSGEEKLTPLTFSPNSQFLVGTTSDTHAVRIWNTDTWEFTDLKGHTDVVTDAEYTTDGKRLFTSSQDGTVKLWDTATSMLLWTFTEMNMAVHRIEITPDGTTLIGLGGELLSPDNSKILKWDLSTFKD